MHIILHRYAILTNGHIFTLERKNYLGEHQESVLIYPQYRS